MLGRFLRKVIFEFRDFGSVYRVGLGVGIYIGGDSVFFYFRGGIYNGIYIYLFVFVKGVYMGKLFSRVELGGYDDSGVMGGEYLEVINMEELIEKNSWVYSV